MKKNLLLGLTMAGAFGLNAQIYQDVTPACFVQGVEDQCASACGDFNGDGYLDIVLTGRANGGHTWLYLNDGQGGFTLAENTGLDKGFIHSSIAVGDYDDDGDLDLAIQGWSPIGGKDVQQAYVYQNNGQGVFTQAAVLDGRSNGVIEFGDYDNDGKMDVLQMGWKADMNPAGAKVTIWHNDGNNVFTDINNTTLFPISDGEARFGDYDKDGNLDILLNGWQQAHIYKGDGKGGFTKQEDIQLTGYDWSFAYWVDYDRDGNLDLLLGGLKEGAFFTDVWKGSGTNAFTKVELGLPGVQVGPIRTGDCDNDGYTDFFISGWNGKGGWNGKDGVFAVYKNDGTNTAFTQVAGVNDVIPGWADGTLEVADFDGDGYAEIFKCGWNATKLYRNTDRPNPPTGVVAASAKPFAVYVNDKVLDIRLDVAAQTSSITVYDLTGNALWQSSFSGSEASFQLPNMGEGCYIVSVQSGDIRHAAVVKW